MWHSHSPASCTGLNRTELCERARRKVGFVMMDKAHPYRHLKRSEEQNCP
jgi:hypothetical protein